jgi:ABC-type lipoprotein export system ATPase subunit
MAPRVAGHYLTQRRPVALLHSGAFAPESFYIGPYSEAALSGLSSTIADEIEPSATKASFDRQVYVSPPDLVAFGQREPQTLSGGEQVLLALHCFSLSSYAAIAIDTALEQLDQPNRDAALDYLDPRKDLVASVALIDNRLPPPLLGWNSRARRGHLGSLAIRAGSSPIAAPPGGDRDPRPHVCLSPRQGHLPCRHLALDGGAAYRLVCRTAPARPRCSSPGRRARTERRRVLVGTEPYRPWRQGNRAIALAQERTTSGAARAARRPGAPPLSLRAGSIPRCSRTRDGSARRALGVHSLEAHLYELPLAARKRLSWLWPLSGALPWVMLDEPSIGQDTKTRLWLAAAIARLTTLGYGVLFVSHDDDFAARIPHRVLAIGDMQIRAG